MDIFNYSVRTNFTPGHILPINSVRTNLSPGLFFFTVTLIYIIFFLKCFFKCENWRVTNIPSIKSTCCLTITWSIWVRYSSPWGHPGIPCTAGAHCCCGGPPTKKGNFKNYLKKNTMNSVNSTHSMRCIVLKNEYIAFRLQVTRPY